MMAVQSQKKSCFFELFPLVARMRAVPGIMLAYIGRLSLSALLRVEQFEGLYALLNKGRRSYGHLGPSRCGGLIKK
jgi:hypothetical protein